MTPAESSGRPPDFIVKKGWTPDEACSLLLRRFPQLLQPQENVEDLEKSGPYYAYGVFASEAVRRLHEPGFLASLASFINELADSDDTLLSDLLTTTILEELAQDLDTASIVRTHLGPKARNMMAQVENDWSGRT